MRQPGVTQRILAQGRASKRDVIEQIGTRRIDEIEAKEYLTITTAYILCNEPRLWNYPTRTHA